MGALYVAGALQDAGYEVRLCESDMGYDEFIRLVHTSRPLFVGFSVYTYPSIKDMVEKSGFVTDMGIPVVWGGAHPTCLPDECREIADHVVIGDGEDGAQEIARHITNGAISSTYTTLSHEYLDRFTPAWNLINPNSYIFPSSHSVRGNNTANPGASRIFYYLSTSRGCPYSCTFCYNSRKPKRRWRGHSVEWIRIQVDYLKQKTHLDGIGFWDDYFFGMRARAIAIIEYLKSQNIKFLVEARASQLRDPLFVTWLKEMGCLQVFIGAESGSNRVLKHIKKEITVEDIIIAVESTCRHNLPLRLSFIYGFPDETHSEMLKTKKLIEYAKTFPNVSISGPKLYTPYPGTAMYEEALRYGFVPPSTISGWSEIHRSTDLKLLPWLDKDKLSELFNFSEDS